MLLAARHHRCCAADVSLQLELWDPARQRSLFSSLALSYAGQVACGMCLVQLSSNHLLTAATHCLQPVQDSAGVRQQQACTSAARRLLLQH